MLLVCAVAPTINCPTDIVFVVDESGSINQRNFDLIKSFLSHLVGRLDIDGGTTRVGLVTYSTTARSRFYLNTYSSVTSVQSAFRNLIHARGWSTNTGDALSYVRTSMLTSWTGDRRSADNVVVVLTDGQSTNKLATRVCIPTFNDYENVCVVRKLDALESRRIVLCKSFFRESVLNEISCSYYLLPSRRVDCFLHDISHNFYH